MKQFQSAVSRAARAALAIGALTWSLQALADAEDGEALYRAICSQCHGLTGQGNGINAPHLEVAPRDHTDAGEMSARTDEELARAISEGGQAVNKSILMPNWGNRLSEREIADLVAYLRQLCCAE